VGTGVNRVLTVPNAVTLVRLACIPVYVVLMAAGRADFWPAALLLAALGATDWVDGFLARRLGQVSTLGKVLDPLADRLLLVTAALSCVVVGAVPLVVAVLALLRETVVAGGFLVVAAFGGRRMEVGLPGKAATLCLMFSLPLYLAGHSGIGWQATAEVLAWCFALPGIALGWFAAATYVAPARRALSEGRVGRS